MILGPSSTVHAMVVCCWESVQRCLICLGCWLWTTSWNVLPFHETNMTAIKFWAIWLCVLYCIKTLKRPLRQKDATFISKTTKYDAYKYQMVSALAADWLIISCHPYVYSILKHASTTPTCMLSLHMLFNFSGSRLSWFAQRHFYKAPDFFLIILRKWLLSFTGLDSH